MSIDNTSIDIAAVLVTAASGIIALFTYLHGKYREKNDFLINVIKMLDDNANRNARRRWFNTVGLDDINKELCLNYMNALTDIKIKGYNEEEIAIYAKSNILESRYKTLSNFELASLYLNRYTPNRLVFWRRLESKLYKEVLLQMYVLDFLSIRKIINSDQNLKIDMERRFINLEKFFYKNKKYLDNKEKQYPDIKIPIKDVDGCKRNHSITL